MKWAVRIPEARSYGWQTVLNACCVKKANGTNACQLSLKSEPLSPSLLLCWSYGSCSFQVWSSNLASLVWLENVCVSCTQNKSLFQQLHFVQARSDATTRTWEVSYKYLVLSLGFRGLVKWATVQCTHIQNTFVFTCFLSSTPTIVYCPFMYF